MVLKIDQQVNLRATLITNMDRGNLVFEFADPAGDRAEQGSVAHAGLVPVAVLDEQAKHNVGLHQLADLDPEALAVHAPAIHAKLKAARPETVNQALDILVPLRKEMILPGEVRSLRDRSAVVVFLGTSIEDKEAPGGRRYNPNGREILLKERILRDAAELPAEDEPESVEASESVPA